MAYVTGTASNAQDLFNALIGFLKNNPALTALGQNWQEVWTGSANEMVLSGPGLAAADDVLLGMKYIPDALNGRYEIRMTGLSGLIPNAIAFDAHVNPCFDPVRIFLADQPMQYWFVASGRRFVATVKVGVTYQSLYGGFFLPYSPPNNYSYPMFIGGSSGVAGVSAPLSWTDITPAHSLFPFASYQIISGYESSAKMMDPSGQWLRCTGLAGSVLSNVGMGPAEQFSGFNTGKIDINDSYGYGNIRGRVEAGFGGYILHRVTLLQTLPSDQTFGILQGVNLVSGHANSAENIVTVAGVPHLVIPNVFRSASDQYMTIALE